MFKIEFETDNSAFEDGGSYEVARVLKDIADAVESGITHDCIMDYNGNVIGAWAWHD